MSRAVILIALLLALCATAWANEVEEIEHGPEMVDGVGMLDFGNRPNFKIGSWVKYRTTSHSLRGLTDDYTVTVQIAGEQVFWGEPCVWVESWTDREGQPQRVTASLISYSAFQDTMAFWHIQWFVRGNSDGVDEKGNPQLNITLRDANELHLRRTNWDAAFKERARVDTLREPEKITVPSGTFSTIRAVRRTAFAQTQDVGDSSYYYRRSGQETYHISNLVPMTRVVRIDITDTQETKAWQAGKFTNDSLQVQEKGEGISALVAYGDSGLTPKLVPERLRHPIDRKLVEEFVNQPAEGATRQIRP